jgi:uncharacterized protein (DUF1800 family)
MSTTGDRFTRAAATLTPDQRAKIAAFRFGLGPKPGLIAKLSQSPNAAFDACMAELTAPNAKTVVMIPQSLTEAQDYERCCLLGGFLEQSGQHRIQELGRRYAKHMEPEIGFVERLVLFWANHFSLQHEKSLLVKATLGHFERTVIRKHVLGSFPEMLQAAISHPAMIGYLDNHTSRKTAVNENLAREILELYTVGTASRFPDRTTDYTQADVESLARIITGWTLDRTVDQAKTPIKPFGQFLFRQDWHDEAAHQLMGQTFSAPGPAKGMDALRWLALHPFTGQHLATKLLRHFVCDDPPAGMVTWLQGVFVNTGGNLMELSKALLRMERAWAAPLRLRPPHLWVVSQARALGFRAADFGTTVDTVDRFWQTRLRQMNNAPWTWPAPDGFPDRDSDWLHPNGMRLRVLIANQILVDAQSRGRTLPVADTLRRQLLPGSTRATSLGGMFASVQNRAALADLFLSSEFMTR